jgi:hypothetical protein
MASTIKVNNIQNQCGANIANKCGTTITLGASGDTITLACGASQTGFGRTGTVDWDTTPKTATFSAVSGNGYFCNTSGGAFTVNLPAGAAGAIVSLADYAATWQTNNVTVTPNGSDNIGGFNENAILNTQGQSVTFVYVDSTQGWINTMDSTSNVRGAAFITATGGTITCCGDYKIHTFTSPGTFCVSSISTTPADNTVSYLVAAGGGGGASGSCSEGGGGAGAGGFREYKNSCDPYTASPLNGNPGGTAVTITATSYPITVGGGGAGGGGPPPAGPAECGSQGSNSVFSTITSTGGGNGGQGNVNPNPVSGGSGGSGGGGGSYNGGPGSGNTPPVSPAQGFNGGPGGPGGPGYAGGGGGGATAVGGCGTSTTGGGGGAGATSSINATPTVRAGGGGGGAHPDGNSGAAGPGGGGAGGAGTAGTAGTANTGGAGGGGGGPSTNFGGTGGSGIVIIRYKYQ